MFSIKRLLHENCHQNFLSYSDVKSILGRAFEDIRGSEPPLGPVKVAQSDSGGVVIQLGDVVVTPEEVSDLICG